MLGWQRLCNFVGEGRQECWDNQAFALFIFSPTILSCLSLFPEHCLLHEPYLELCHFLHCREFVALKCEIFCGFIVWDKPLTAELGQNCSPGLVNKVFFSPLSPLRLIPITEPRCVCLLFLPPHPHHNCSEHPHHLQVLSWGFAPLFPQTPKDHPSRPLKITPAHLPSVFLTKYSSAYIQDFSGYLVPLKPGEEASCKNLFLLTQTNHRPSFSSKA